MDYPPSAFARYACDSTCPTADKHSSFCWPSSLLLGGSNVGSGVYGWSRGSSDGSFGSFGSSGNSGGSSRGRRWRSGLLCFRLCAEIEVVAHGAARSAHSGSRLGSGNSWDFFGSCRRGGRRGLGRLCLSCFGLGRCSLRWLLNSSGSGGNRSSSTGRFRA